MERSSAAGAAGRLVGREAAARAPAASSVSRRSVSAVIDVWMTERIMDHSVSLAKHNPINRHDKVPIWTQTMRLAGGRALQFHNLCLPKSAEGNLFELQLIKGLQSLSFKTLD